MGRQQDLEELDLISLRPYIDVLDLNEEGTHAFTVQFDLEEEFDVMSVSTVMIQVIARPELPVEDEEQMPEGELPEGDLSDIPEVPEEDAEQDESEIIEDGSQTGE